MTASLTLSQARRIALRAQGLADKRPTGPVTARQVGRTLDRIKLLQIDSVNVLCRSQYLPLFSRLGPYESSIIDRWSGKAPRRLVEYWAHEASLILPPLLPPLKLWQRRTWMGAHRMEQDEREELSARILAVLAASKPLTAREVAARLGHAEDPSREDWGWNWSAVKRILEHLFADGTVSAASRTRQFERRYTLMERVIPTTLDPDGKELTPQLALKRLVQQAARAHGIGTVRCFADYFRTPTRESALAVRDLVDEGVLVPVNVDGWNRQVYRHSEATLPRQATGRALLSPFDSLVFERSRVEALFRFHYRLEIYTPAAQRRFGYYVLPFLLGESMVARVDLKADRERSSLLVRSAFTEPGAPPETALELAAELRLMARWLGLCHILVEPVGDLFVELDHHLRNAVGVD